MYLLNKRFMRKVKVLLYLLFSLSAIFLVVSYVLFSKEKIEESRDSGQVIYSVLPRNVATTVPKIYTSFNKTRVDETTLSPESPSSNMSLLSSQVTVVTAYFNIGSFQKGDIDTYTPKHYLRWMTVFSRISNPLVVYLDTDESINYFKIIRSSLPKHLTKIIKISRENLWSFNLESRIQAIFNQPGYPRHYPNTVLALYSSVVHAKYELVQRTIQENPFRTRYMCWLDIGLFRDLIMPENNPAVPSGPLFKLHLPIGLKKNHVAYGEVKRRLHELEAFRIIYGNFEWVCGCFFIGNVEAMFRWTAEYMEGVEWLLRNKLMSTDQQVIYSLANYQLIDTRIQTYRGDYRYNSWFVLGYLSKEAGEFREMQAASKVRHSIQKHQNARKRTRLYTKDDKAVTNSLEDEDLSDFINSSNLINSKKIS